MDNKKKELRSIYIRSLKLVNLKCFKEEMIIDFNNKDGVLSQWTVILGSNNTGKTTILKTIATLCLGIEGYNSLWSYRPSYFEMQLLETINSQNIVFKEQNSSWEILNKKTQDEDDQSSYMLFSKPDFFAAYGIQRKSSKTTITKSNGIEKSNTSTLFSDTVTLINIEEWLIQLDYAQKNGQTKAGATLQKVKKLLISGLLPDIQDFRFTSTEDFSSFVEFQTDYGWIRLGELGYGYQASIAWLIDLAKKMFDFYPEKENPLEGAAVVLVDELDLHLHPEWQRKIIGFLSKQFPNTQFIVTAHSPLIVQSAEKVNVVLLKKEGNQVIVEQPEIPTFTGWTVEEILTELMGMDDRVYSDKYLDLMNRFESALDTDNYTQAQAAYDALDQILHPQSSQRKLMRIQMAGMEV